MMLISKFRVNAIFRSVFVRHWNGNVFILMKFSSLAALKVVKMTTSSAASDENFIKMTTFSFQWHGVVCRILRDSLEVSIMKGISPGVLVIVIYYGMCANSLRPVDVYMCHSTGSLLVLIMACRLYGTKSLTESMLTCCRLNPYEQI